MNKSRLTLISDVKKEGRRYLGTYRCECGVEKKLDAHKVLSCHTRSCGCLAKDLLRSRQTTHGHYYEPEHQTWRNMLKRCSDLRFQQWYGDISVCRQWAASYETFLKDVGRKPLPDATLDRIDPKGHYEPNNVRWATRVVQSRNTKNHASNKTGARGVSWSKTKNKWRAAIYVDSKQKHLGYFDSFADAVNARQTGEKKYWKN